MKICFVGAGYVGIVTAIAFAELGYQVTLIDVDAKRIDKLKKGQSPIFEPGLDSLLATHMGHNLSATLDYKAIEEADVVFITVGTPAKQDGSADLSYVKAAVAKIAKHISSAHFTVIVNKSTLPVGAVEMVGEIIADHNNTLEPGTHFAVVSNPEFLSEGNAIHDVFYPDRIVVGSDDEHAANVMRKLYRPFLLRSPRTLYFDTDTRSSELIKYASNAFLAVKISYANELAKLSDALGANIQDVTHGMGLDRRIGDKFLGISGGWGGSCFPKDTQQLLSTAYSHRINLSIISSAVKANQQQPLYCIDKLRSYLDLESKKIALLGLTFKAGTDDVRDTQATVFIRELLTMGCEVSVHDPRGMDSFHHAYPGLGVNYCETVLSAVSGGDALILLTDWPEYKHLSWSDVYKSMEQHYILDTRNFLDKNSLLSIGFKYIGIGL